MKRDKLVKFIFASTLTIWIWGCHKELSTDPVFTLEKNKIICDNFSIEKIETDSNHVLISDVEDIYIFKHEGQSLSLIQKIDFEKSSVVFSVVAHHGTMAIGRAEPAGDGKVFIYKRNKDLWELKQVIFIGRYEDNFGSAIDFTDSYMVIGADARWNNMGRDPHEGHVYVYRNNGSEWIYETELISEFSSLGDNFGGSVAICNNVILVGPILQIYTYNTTWQLLRTDNISATSIVHDEANFLIRDEYSDQGLCSFILEADGSFNYKTIDFNFNSNEISNNGEEVEIKNNLALIDAQTRDICFMMKYENNQWNTVGQFGPDNGETCEFFALEITDQFVIMGGPDDIYSGNGRSIVYFRNR
jgi:hypothetical protein